MPVSAAPTGLPECPPWLIAALQQHGVHEAAGAAQSAEVLRYHAATDLRATDDAVPWCGAFVSWCMRQAGQVPPSGSAAARSWLAWGAKSGPRFGCVVVLTREGAPGSGHVGFLVGSRSPDTIEVLGGNQSDAVKVSTFRRADVLGWRWSV